MLKAGFYETDITPAIGMERPATYYKIYIQTINDPLKVHAVVISNGEHILAFAGVDICYLGDGVTERVRKALPEMKVMLSVSHTHYGGPMGGAQKEDFAEKVDPEIQRMIREESVTADPRYTGHLVDQIVTAIRMAEQRMVEVEVSFGKSSVEGVTFNRGFKMKDGSRATHPGKGNSRIVEPFEPIDTEVGVMGFWEKGSGAFLGCMVNFSCHGTCDGTGATADWPGQMTKTIRAVMGEECGVVYLYGCAGDITQIDNQSLSPLESGPEYSRIVGVSVGAEVLQILMKAKKGEITDLIYFSDVLEVERRKPSAKSLEEARVLVAGSEKGTAYFFAKERLITDELCKHYPKLELEIQIFQLGPLVIAAIPGELFCAIALDVKKVSAFPFTWVSSLANDMVCGYIPTRAALTPGTGGGYETRLTAFTCTEIGAAEKITEKINSMIAPLTPGAVPTGPLVEPSHTVWSFGNNAPELE